MDSLSCELVCFFQTNAFWSSFHRKHQKVFSLWHKSFSSLYPCKYFFTNQYLLSIFLLLDLAIIFICFQRTPHLLKILLWYVQEKFCNNCTSHTFKGDLGLLFHLNSYSHQQSLFDFILPFFHHRLLSHFFLFLPCVVEIDSSLEQQWPEGNCNEIKASFHSRLPLADILYDFDPALHRFSSKLACGTNCML